MEALESSHRIRGTSLLYFFVILIVLYSVLCLAGFYSLLKTVRYGSSSALIRQRTFYFLLSLICCCSRHVGRIVWSTLYFVRFTTLELIYLFDALPSIFLCFLGSTISLLWFEIYLDTYICIIRGNRQLYLVLSWICYAVLNCGSITYHILLVYNRDGSWSMLRDSWKDTIILDGICNFILALMIIVSGVLLSNSIHRVFSDKFGKVISKRLRFLAFIACFLYFSKTVSMVCMYIFDLYSSKDMLQE
jgi:hypothetical protein